MNGGPEVQTARRLVYLEEKGHVKEKLEIRLEMFHQGQHN